MGHYISLLGSVTGGSLIGGIIGPVLGNLTSALLTDQDPETIFRYIYQGAIQGGAIDELKSIYYQLPFIFAY